MAIFEPNELCSNTETTFNTKKKRKEKTRKQKGIGIFRINRGPFCFRNISCSC